MCLVSAEGIQCAQEGVVEGKANRHLPEEIMLPASR